ncbi:uncharacterized protein LOC130995322 [Salvia miltiorrhiza]|uniref:uncharacterized protein LOC130995322 n=1 Tax=Salvia miltiorrhiza TaxID=226208 RepID=UPI0025AC30BA|nr:uncharacterized protein LOC130995322 [Salvia miltiorrhiza]
MRNEKQSVKCKLACKFKGIRNPTCLHLSHVPTPLFQVSFGLDVAAFPFVHSPLIITTPSTPSLPCCRKKMIQTINPYATARTAEIMSRYRPIAPKPEAPAAANSTADNDGIQKSPYLRNVWAHLQARPTRTRKRGRTAAFSPPSVKRPRTYQLASPAMHAFTRPISIDAPLLYCAAPPPKGKGIDLNLTADQAPEELDLLLHLHAPKPSVISPRPVRPVGSSIIVELIEDDPQRPTMAKGAEEAVESEAVPAIVSDSNNKVRMCNSAYKEMVGQPECCWLDCAASGKRGRIGGEVSLRFVESEVQQSMAAFTCSVRIEWETQGKKMCVNASCSAVKLVCQSKDYQFLWRFHNSKSAAAHSDNSNL